MGGIPGQAQALPAAFPYSSSLFLQRKVACPSRWGVWLWLGSVTLRSQIITAGRQLSLGLGKGMVMAAWWVRGQERAQATCGPRAQVSEIALGLLVVEGASLGDVLLGIPWPEGA